MRAYHLSEPRLDALRRVEIDPPQPGPGEVLLRLRAASLNYLDLAVATGVFPVPSWPLIPGTDGAGEVAALGAGVGGLAIGARVVAHFMPDWPAGALTPRATDRLRGVTMPGSLADCAVVPAAAVLPIPDGLSFEAAASLPIAATTAWNAIRAGRVGPGSTVLLLGTGGVSLFALQFAKAAGARVIVTSSSDEKLARARALGADEGINYRRTPDWDAEVLRLTEGAGADLVVETGGAETFARSLAAAAIEGSIHVVGMLSGGDLALSVFPILLKRLHIRGSNTGSVADFRATLKAIERTGIQPVVDRVFDFDAAPEAYALLARGGHFGKLAIAI